MDTLRKTFADPPATLRGAPFWSWNDRLEPAELARQIRDMKAHGMGGFFMHSRDGLETEYMGPEWMECIRECVRVAREEGMNAWLYDEDRWPSGAAGGLVPARGGDAFRAKVVTVEQASRYPAGDADVLAVFRATVSDGQITAAKRIRRGVALAEGETLLVFRREVSGPSEWFNDDAYADNLNPDAVAAFRDITYEAYRQDIGSDWGGAVPGIFTDEPNVFAVQVTSGRRALPWTDGLPEFFQERRGYDLLEVLPWLFYDGERAAKARHDYWYTISQRFTEAYSKQLGEWCGEHNLAFTGHYLCEAELGLAIMRGGAIMPHYRWQQVPGIDMLTEQTHEFNTVKQCSSVANQFGRQRVLSETYGCSSWEFTFEGQKWVGDWQYVLGVNLRCQHLALYSLRGCRKRDYPPSFNYNTTWWKYNKVVEDYFARVGSITTAGEAVRDVLLLHPVSTGWAMLGEGVASQDQVDAYGERYNDFIQAVLATHYDCDLGDEQIMADSCRIEGDMLYVGRAPYRVVVVPPEMKTLLGSTVAVLDGYLAAGGKVIVVGEPPSLIEAEPAERLSALWQQPGVTRIADASQLQGALEAAVARRVSLRTIYGQEAASLLYMQRDIDGCQAYFITNGDRSNGYDLEVRLQGKGRVEQWDPLTGKATPVPADVLDGQVRFFANIGPAGSLLYVIDPQGEPVAGAVERIAPVFRVSRHVTRAQFIGPECTLKRTDPNVLTLDRCCYTVGDREWSDEMEVWRAQSEVREMLGMRQNYYNGLPQRYKWATKPHPNDDTPVALEFTFEVRDVPEAPVYLLVEGAAQFGIALNDEPVPNRALGWYLDRSFHKVLLPELLPGENWLELSCLYTNHMELEDCFLIGDFGIDTDRAIIAEPDSLHFGDWTSQGYLHYAGSMIYEGTFVYRPELGRRVRVYLQDYQAVDVAVHVNGAVAGHIPWASANGLDITDHLGPGVNNIGIEVVSSPRNMLGPLHLATGREAWTDWRSFRRTDETFTPDYVVKDWGLYGQVIIQHCDA
ncbi:MAG: glycosyl hydrolase [Anaerolineales bacterium]